MKGKIYEKGITLIALVITIVILLILAGVTLNLVFNGGIINKSQTAVDKYTEEQAKEKLSLALFEYKMDKVTKKEGTDLQTTLSDLGNVRIVEDTNYYEVEIEGYLFWVHKDTLEIISKGPSNPVPPTTIEFSSATAEAYIGEGTIFSLTLEPPKANPKFLKWSVSDESVAKIQNGVLIGVKEGTVVVTVTSTEDASIIATCTVIVKPIELTEIKLNKKSTTIGMGKTEKLEVTYTPANATYKDIIWSTSDDTIATVENGTLRGIKAGTATITATSVKNSSINAECNVTVEEIIEISTVEELKAFRDNVNNGNTYAGKKVVLTNDLDLNPGKYTVASDGTVTFSEDAEQWTPIGTETNYFSGNFDGQGHIISGIYIDSTEKNQGLFGYVLGPSSSNKSVIENIKVEKVSIKGGNNTGGIVGYLSYSQIKKCGASGIIVGTRSNIGGIVGNVSNCIDVSQCYNLATVRGEGTDQSYIGGIAGSTGSKVINCYNIGNVMGNCGVGGIAGNLTSNSVKIYNCYNLGNIDQADNSINSFGGIIGIFIGNEIKDCYNLGNVNGKNVTGGIIGYLNNNNDINIEDCYNKGIISGTNYIGGCIGNLNAANITINNCGYLKNSASAGIGIISSGTAKIEESDTLPSVLSVINGDNAFVEDTNNINDGYPIFNWQDK